MEANLIHFKWGGRVDRYSLAKNIAYQSKQVSPLGDLSAGTWKVSSYLFVIGDYTVNAAYRFSLLRSSAISDTGTGEVAD